MSSEEYTSLVREQLDALGYDSASIPDTVLKDFLTDFEHMDVTEGGDNDDDVAPPLSYPTALSEAEADAVTRAAAPAASKTKSSAARARGGSAASSGRVAARKAPRGSSASSSSRGAGSAPATTLPVDDMDEGSPKAGSRGLAEDEDATIAGSPPLASAAFGSALTGKEAEFLAGGSDKIPEFERAHWDAMRPQSARSSSDARKSHLCSASAVSIGARPSSNASSRPSSARTPGADAARDAARELARVMAPPPPAVAPGCVGGFVGGGVIISASGFGSQLYGGTPRRAKSDPVSMHAQRLKQWRSDSFLSSGKQRVVSVASPTPAATVAASRRRPNSYVVPTAKRRDDLVWQTRMRMRETDPDAGGKAHRPHSKQLQPNRFVPCTEKRRDDLRWAQRAQMAWTG